MAAAEGSVGRHGWPVERAQEALEALARRSGLTAASVARPALPPAPRSLASDGSGLGAWIEETAARLGLEAEETETSHSSADQLVGGCGPALLELPRPGGGDLVLAVLGGRGGRVRLLGPDLAVHRVPRQQVVRALCREVEEPVRPKVDRLLEKARVPRRRRARARECLLREQLRQVRLGGCWLLRLPPGSSFWAQVRHQGLPRIALELVVAYAVSYWLLLMSWWVLGHGALSGQLSRGWLLAWVLLLFTLIVPRLLAIWAQARLAVGLGSLLKRRLLQGALRLEPDEIRHQGAGELLGRVIESEAVQTLALLGGFMAAMAVVELALAAWVMSQGAGGWLHLALLTGWLLVMGLIAWRYYVRRHAWTGHRLRMTHELVESMVGHRTRLAQEPSDRWHEREDQLLEGYLTASRSLDRQRALFVLAPSVWPLLGIGGLMPAFVLGEVSAGSLALGIGGVVVAFRALSQLARGFSSLTGSWISWRQTAPVFHAAARSDDVPTDAPRVSRGGGEAETSRPILEARDLEFRYRSRARPVFEGLSLAIRAGDRLLLEGPSGGGKSTLAAVLTRLRRPDSGLLLFEGLDRYTVGAEVWRRNVVSAPQFHENHVFTETFAFNLLMGRRWPPSHEDLREAEEICQRLGLGELLERMPGGILQLVGETGWQLSHGEKSRLYMARALLQGAEVVILDESFAALDPENLHRCLMCALERAPTLLVIAHP